MATETQVAPKPPAERNSSPMAAASSNAAATRTPNRKVQAVGNILTVLGIMLLTFVLTISVIGSLQFARDQKTMYANFRVALANAVAPVSQLTATGGFVPLGTPVVLLSFPSLGKQFVVVEGTTANVLMGAPGHRRDTVLPGQSGQSVIVGRRSMYGGPFASLLDLHVGDKIVTTTGQGRSVYTVFKIRTAGDKLVIQPSANILTLETAAGSPYQPSGVYYVDAKLDTAANPGNNSYITYPNLLPAERSMQGQSSNWVAVLLLSQALLLAVVGVVWLYFRQGRLVAWVVGLPLLLALGVALSNQIAGLLPNLM